MALHAKIDVHAHFVPPCWRDALLAHGLEHPDGMPAIPHWDLESHLELMDSMNIEKSYLSITSPGIHLVADNNVLARKLARECNMYAYNLKQNAPGRFGSFASLPLPDLKGSIEELDYVTDTLNADGVVLQTNYFGRYLGDDYFHPIFEELDRRRMVVFIHPTTPCVAPGSSHGCAHHDDHKSVPLPQYPVPLFEFMFDTCRCLINLFLSGTVSKYPHIRYIVPHAGGAFPPLIQRFSEAAMLIPDLSLDRAVTPQSVRAALNEKFWFDTAGPTFPSQIRGLLQYVTPDRLCYGTDFPFTPPNGVQNLARAMEDSLSTVLEDEQAREAFYNLNARKLLDQNAS
ncbi:hypothetical protein BJY01DRAFT_236216 [Aspergillus pseudoustus]|uniref:6-methylsalicylate decarboxylase n=1 Tax=Aspergillus pseudoustus TaxID=1810923 RepID=A0ABR4JP88_9EURO